MSLASLLSDAHTRDAARRAYAAPVLPVALPIYDSISDAHIAELTRQRDALLEQVGQLSAIVRAVPSMLVSARLDAKQGKPTVYDYKASARALAIR